MERIASRYHEKLKQAAGLAQKKQRERQGLFLLEGVRLLAEARQAGVSLETVFYCPELAGEAVPPPVDQLLAEGIPCYSLDQALFSRLSQTENPQGVVAVARQFEFAIDEALQAGALHLVLDGLQDPGNLGTAIRTADAAGVNAVLITGNSVDVYNPKVVRATMGSLFHLPVVAMDAARVFDCCRAKGIRLFVGSPGAAVSCYQADFREGVALVVGNENRGPSQLFLAQADEAIRIPMPGRAESLNAAVAAGILVYEAVRQRAVPRA